MNDGKFVWLKMAQPSRKVSATLALLWDRNRWFSRRASSSSQDSCEGLGVDQAPVPWAPAWTCLSLTAAEDRFGLLVRDDEAALPRLQLEQGGASLRGRFADLRHGSDIRKRARGATRSGLRRVPCRRELSTAWSIIHRIKEVSARRGCRGALLRQLGAQSDDGNRCWSRRGRQPKIDGLWPLRDKSLHQGTIQTVRWGAMDGWERHTAQP